MNKKFTRIFMTRCLFAFILFFSVILAHADYDPASQQQDAEICKQQSSGFFLGVLSASAFNACLNERQHNRQIAEEQAQAIAIQNLEQGSPCWKPNLSQYEYTQCINGLGDDNLKAELERMDAGCDEQVSLCRFKSAVQSIQNERKIEIDKDRIAKQQLVQKDEYERMQKDYAQAQKELADNITRAAAEEEKKKIACGASYHKIRVGMDFSRIQQCYTPFRLVSEINRADGIVSIYVAQTGARVHVMNGKVISWYSN